jgi:hypothetical protein
MPRRVLEYIEDTLKEKLNIQDNKYVLVCIDKVNFGTDDFCIFFKDLYVRVGKLDDIVDY